MNHKLRKNYRRFKCRVRRRALFKTLDELFARALLLAEADRKFEKFYVRHEIGLEEMPREKFELFFRLRSYADFCRLLEALDLPERIVCDNGTAVSAEVALAVTLRRLAYPCRWVDTMDFLGRDRTQLSRIFNTTLDLIYDKKGWLLESLGWITRERIEKYADAIHRASKGRYAHCWGFIDGTARAICKPSLYQEDYYSGHAGTHALKFQSVVAPDGLIINMFGPVEGRRHDVLCCLRVSCENGYRGRTSIGETPSIACLQTKVTISRLKFKLRIKVSI
ncbi:uncharacterized protein LOC129601996 [Paramacrobiotus metropolitanus]|uniref:uncharacterized protein LOC129601996 n=1 Tax=Paramacrobiotus metropolitanus TaxID=2943436 RepID=UPI0024461D30|nr:uncharacterized protein LOC129601996 [Paramacrobiotus metropolitanus]